MMTYAHLIGLMETPNSFSMIMVMTKVKSIVVTTYVFLKAIKT